MRKIVVIALVVALLATIVSNFSVVLAEDPEVTFPDSNLEAFVRETISKPDGTIYASDLAGLSTLWAPTKNISNITGLEYCTNLKVLSLSQNHIEDITPLQNLTSLEELHLQNNYLITDLSPLANLTNLTKLDFGDNKVSDVTPIANLTNLQSLGVYYNQIVDISALGSLTNLTYLVLSGNDIYDLTPISNMTKMDYLLIGMNEVSDATPLEDLPNLETLYLFSNHISDLTPFGKITSLKTLLISNNPISDITPLANLPDLERLELWGCQISDISPLTNLTKMTTLTLRRNQISDISPLANLTNLTSLDLYDNDIEGITPLANLANLVTLNIAKNNIDQIGALSGITELGTLFLDNNQIIDITPLSSLTKLGETDSKYIDTRVGKSIHLGLQNNQIADITSLLDNAGLSEDDGIDLRGNPLSDESYNTVIPQLEGRGVVLLYDTNQAPSKPTNTSPSDGADGIDLTPLLQSSTFSDSDDGDTHLSTQWQVSTILGDYNNPVFDSGTDSDNLESILIPSETLGNSTTYYWRVRYQDNNGAWSEWSSETSYTTNQPPSRPTNTSPSDTAADAGLTHVLQSSAFSDPNAGNTHIASQWQVSTTPGDYSNPVFDSGTDTNNLTSISIPSGTLDYSTTYYWRVRYQDNSGTWSEWSPETSFIPEKKAIGLSSRMWIIVGAGMAFLIAVVVYIVNRGDTIESEK